jgi:hypothetical protein
MTRAISTQSPDRSPSIPAPFPAALMSWQGKPPETTSTRPRHGRPSKVPYVRPYWEGFENAVVLPLCKNGCGVGIKFNGADGSPPEELSPEYSSTSAREKSQLIQAIPSRGTAAA